MNILCAKMGTDIAWCTVKGCAMNEPNFHLISHTADLKIEVRAGSLEQLFADCARAMFLAMKPRVEHPDRFQIKSDLACQKFSCVREITIDETDRELLLVDFLSEALYLSDVYHETYLDAQVKISGNQLKARLSGVPVIGWDASHIKAVTYSDLVVEQCDMQWRACVVFDI